jgi:hypothetical protein
MHGLGMVKHSSLACKNPPHHGSIVNISLKRTRSNHCHISKNRKKGIETGELYERIAQIVTALV